jgi:hypothetical protein
MADPVAPPELDRASTSPVLIVAGTVLVVALVSFLLYSVGGYKEERDVFAGAQSKAADPAAAGAGACGFGQPDDSYSLSVASEPEPPRPEGTTLRLTVRQGGRTVTGAKVCMTTDMPDMRHPGLNTVAKEVPGGRYETQVTFGMGGAWRASVTIAEPGKPVVSVTVPIDVAEVE